MTAVDTALQFTAAWLAVGFGMFVASGSLRRMRRHAIYALTLVLALGLVGAGLYGFVKVVPW